MIFRSARLEDLIQIQEIEREYYEGFNCPEETLKLWINNLPDNFIIAEQGNKILGFIFFEYLSEVKPIPFIHEIENKKEGKFVYISEVGVRDKHELIMQQLFDEVLKKVKKDGCEKVIWLTGYKHGHDKMELGILEQNGFRKIKKVINWEYLPKKFVSDHWLWEKIV